MYTNLGTAWASSTLGFISIAFIPIPFVLYAVSATSLTPVYIASQATDGFVVWTHIKEEFQQDCQERHLDFMDGLLDCESCFAVGFSIIFGLPMRDVRMSCMVQTIG